MKVIHVLLMAASALAQAPSCTHIQCKADEKACYYGYLYTPDCPPQPLCVPTKGMSKNELHIYNIYSSRS